MQDAHRDWATQYERDRVRIRAAYRRQMTTVALIVGGFLVMAGTAALLAFWRLP